MRVAQMLIQTFRRCVLFLDSPSERLFIEIVIKMHKIKLRMNKKQIETLGTTRMSK